MIIRDGSFAGWKSSLIYPTPLDSPSSMIPKYHHWPFSLMIIYLCHGVTVDCEVMRSMKEGCFVMLAWPWNLLGGVKRWGVLWFYAFRTAEQKQTKLLYMCILYSCALSQHHYIVMPAHHAITLSRWRDVLHPLWCEASAFTAPQSRFDALPLSSYQPKEKAP